MHVSDGSFPGYIHRIMIKLIVRFMMYSMFWKPCRLKDLKWHNGFSVSWWMCNQKKSTSTDNVCSKHYAVWQTQNDRQSIIKCHHAIESVEPIQALNPNDSSHLPLITSRLFPPTSDISTWGGIHKTKADHNLICVCVYVFVSVCDHKKRLPCQIRGEPQLGPV